MTRKHRKRPSYEWIRALGALDNPAFADLYAPDVWERVAIARLRLLPSQRIVFDLYRTGCGVAAIADHLNWKKASVYKRLAELHRAIRPALVRNDADSD